MVAPEQMCPIIMCAPCETSFVAVFVATSGLHTSSSMSNSILFPLIPPEVFKSLITISAALTVGRPYEARSPLCAPATPILIVSSGAFSHAAIAIKKDIETMTDKIL